jgi:hypothetical protein
MPDDDTLTLERQLSAEIIAAYLRRNQVARTR